MVEDTPVDSLLRQLGPSDQPALPVVDEAGRVTGVITAADLARAARDAGSLGTLVLAADLAGPTEVVAAADSLQEAVRQLGVRGASAVPVVDPASGRLTGLLTRAHVLAAYERALGGHPADPAPAAEAPADEAELTAGPSRA